MIFTSPHLVYCCPTAAKAPEGYTRGFLFPYVLQVFLWRARQDSNLRPSLFVVILLHRQGGTVGDRERQISAFIRVSVFLRGHRGTGRDTRLRSKHT